MKILVVGPHYFDSMAWSVLETLKRMGHAVENFNNFKLLGLRHPSKLNQVMWHFLRMTCREPERFTNKKLVQKAKRMIPDLILIIGGQNIHPRCVAELKKSTEAKIVAWFGDHISNLGRQYLIGADYDALFFKEPYIVEKLRKNLGRDNIFCLPQCCDPTIHKPVELTDDEKEFYGCDIVVVGNIYYYREQLLKQLKRYNIKIWGSKPPLWLKDPYLKNFHMGRPVWGLEKAKTFRAAKIVLNSNHYSEIWGVNKRTFEAAGCGAFQIVDNLPGLEGLFEKGKEIVVFDDLQDLKEKIEYYIHHPEERREISNRACRRTHDEHTYEKRLERLLNIAGCQ
jgi:spore maturation protein CgeB